MAKKTQISNFNSRVKRAFGAQAVGRLPQRLLRSDRPIKDPQTVFGCFDGFHDDRLAGWVYEPLISPRASRVGLFIDGYLALEALACEYRKDLEDAGFGDGCHAFSFPLDKVLGDDTSQRALTDFTPRTFEVRLMASNIKIEGQHLVLSPAAMLLIASARIFQGPLDGSIVPLEFGDV